MPINVKCANCKNLFKVDPYRLASRKTCSRACHHELRRANLLALRRSVPQPKAYRVIPLSNGSVAKVSKEDYAHLSSTFWHRNRYGYALDREGKSMHKNIMKRLHGDYGDLLVDHINMDRLDNRRDNLRLVTKSQNGFNRLATVGSASPHKGIRRDGKAWQARIMCDGKSFQIGNYTDEAEAAWMRDQWSLALHGEHAQLNFDYQ